MTTLVGVAVWAVRGYINRVVEMMENKFANIDRKLSTVGTNQSVCQTNLLPEILQRITTVETQLKARKEGFKNFLDKMP